MIFIINSTLKQIKMEIKETKGKQRGLPKGHTKALKGYYFLFENEVYPSIASLARKLKKNPTAIYPIISRLKLENIMAHQGVFIYNRYFITIKKVVE